MKAKEPKFDLRFPLSEIRYWAGEYSYSSSNAEPPLLRLKPRIRRSRRLTKDQLVEICRWKATRSAGNALRNDPAYVERITALSFSTSNERARIELLTLLDGVGWPTASVILHFFHKGRYPILDYRALWSLRAKPPRKYTFDFWWRYTLYCRGIAGKASVRMRTLDKALWQYSQERQR
jgi:hypothetical protein